MTKSIPDTDQRTAACFAQWDKAQPDDRLRRMAYDKFGDGFKHVDNVCEFTEHATKGRDDKPNIYDRNALVGILTRLNHRIADTGDFSPVVEGHTPDPDEVAQGRSQPDVLGYAGPFRLGMIGNENPRWAIFGDEHHHVEAVDKLKRLRRRSPEVWLEDKMEDRFFDPIAALGATTPRLDLGMAPIAYKLCRSASGRYVAKYSAAAPGPMTTSVQSDNILRKDYSGETPMDEGKEPQAGQQSPLSPEAVAQVVTAFLETDVAKWCMSQMEATAQPTVPTPPPAAEVPAPPAVAPAVLAEPSAAEAEAEDPTQDMTDEEKKHYACMPDGMKKSYSAWKKSYAAEATVVDELVNQESGEVADNLQNTEPATVSEIDKLQRLSREHHAAKETNVDKARYEKLERENREMSTRLKGAEDAIAKEKYEKSYALRKAQLKSLRYEHGLNVDLEKEDVRCDPAKMNDEVFADHVSCIKENYQKIPVNIRVHHPELDVQTRLDDQLSEKISREATQLCMENRQKNEHYQYEQAHREVSEKYGRKSAIA